MVMSGIPALRALAHALKYERPQLRKSAISIPECLLSERRSHDGRGPFSEAEESSVDGLPIREVALHIRIDNLSVTDWNPWRKLDGVMIMRSRLPSSHPPVGA